jgi:hypothetical protein
MEDKSDKLEGDIHSNLKMTPEQLAYWQEKEPWNFLPLDKLGIVIDSEESETIEAEKKSWQDKIGKKTD